MKYSILLFVPLLLFSCKKEVINKPAPVSQASLPVEYKDNNIFITDFKADASSSGTVILFSTLYQKNISAIDIMRGSSYNNLCVINTEKINSDSNKKIKYSYTDNQAKEGTVYYMIRFTLKNSDWGFTPLYQYIR